MKALEEAKELLVDVKIDVEKEGVEQFGYIETKLEVIIAELEALQQRKSCEGCKHMNNPLTGYKCKICFRLEVPFKDRYEAKDEQ